MQESFAGRVMLTRLEPTDGEELRRLFFRLSPTTLFRRFHSPIVRPEQAHPEQLLDIDHRDREAVVGVVDGEIIGVARYTRLPGTTQADLAVVVADDWQRRGLATRMLSVLEGLARSAGVQAFTASVQCDNQPAIQLLRGFNPSARAMFADGSCDFTLPIRG